MQNVKEKFNRRNLTLLVILILVVAVPLIVMVSQKSQDIRQRASGEEAIVFFAELGSSNITPLTQINLSPDQQKVLGIFIDSGNININGFDITVSIANALQYVTINSAGEGTDSEKFEKLLARDLDQANGIIHFAKVTDDTSKVIKGKLHIGSIAFTVKSNVNGSGTIGVTRAEITSYGRNPLTVDKSKTLAYIIGSFSNPTNTPTQTPIPTATGTAAPGAMRFNFDLILTGVGPNGGNTNPRHQQRGISVGIYSATEMLVKTVPGTINFQSSGTFRGSVDVSDLIPGNYTLKVTIMDSQNKDIYLTKRMPGVQEITSTGGQIDILSTALIVGDINHNSPSDNAIDVLDFNIIRDCYGEKASNPRSCPNPQAADLNDDGTGGDNTDYTLLMLSLSSQKGD